MQEFDFPAAIHIFQKDSKTITAYSPATGQLQHKFVEFRGNFPHNFQMI